MKVDIENVNGNVFNIEELQELNIEKASAKEIKKKAKSLKKGLVDENLKASIEEMKNWIQLIAENQMEEVFKRWIPSLENSDPKMLQKVLDMKGRYEQINQLLNDGKLTNAEYLTEMNKVRASMLNLIINILKNK